MAAGFNWRLQNRQRDLGKLLGNGKQKQLSFRKAEPPGGKRFEHLA